MNCLACDHENPATVSYCQKCGKKLNLTADEIREALLSKAKEETARGTEYYTRQTLFFAIVAFAVSLLFLLVSGTPPTGSFYVPSISNGAKYIEVTYRLDAPIQRKMLIPYSTKRR